MRSTASSGTPSCALMVFNRSSWDSDNTMCALVAISRRSIAMAVMCMRKTWLLSKIFAIVMFMYRTSHGSTNNWWPYSYCTRNYSTNCRKEGKPTFLESGLTQLRTALAATTHCQRGMERKLVACQEGQDASSLAGELTKRLEIQNRCQYQLPEINSQRR